MPPTRPAYLGDFGTGSPPPPYGSTDPFGLGAPQLSLEAPRTYHIASWDYLDDRKRVAMLRKIAEPAGRDPRIREIAIAILQGSGCGAREFERQAGALLAWVQNNILYVNEPGEVLQDPNYTLKVRFGDCLPEDTLLLNDKHELVPIAQIKQGDRIWGKDKWSTVADVWEKGPLEVVTVSLNNGSSFRATADHKLYVDACKRHGAHCRSRNYTCEEREVVRLPISEVEPQDILIQPERIDFGKTDTDPRVAYVEGLYIADGWVGFTGSARESAPSRFSIAGKDGHPKEAQKREVQEICAALEIDTRWHERYLAINSPLWAQRLGAEFGSGAVNKRAASISLTEAAASELLRGIMADAGENSSVGVTFTTTSRMLAIQTRVLHRMFGRDCGARYIEKHGGLGKNPIYRLGVRTNVGRKQLRVESIERTGETVPCYDISTDDHYVYLPEADVTVSNCDDCAILLGSFCEAIALPWKFVLSGTRAGQKIRWIEGDSYPSGASWTHIYVSIGWPPGAPVQWAIAEPTVRGVPLGMDIAMTGSVMPEMQAGLGRAFGSLAIDRLGRVTPSTPWGPLPAYTPPAYGVTALMTPSTASTRAVTAAILADLDWKHIASATIVGVTVSVLGQLVIDAVHAWRGVKL